MATYDDWKTRTPDDEHAMHCRGCVYCIDPDHDDMREGREEIRQAIREAEESAAHFAAKAKECEEALERFKEAAEQFIREAAAADTHSSDVDPGRVDPWNDK